MAFVSVTTFPVFDRNLGYYSQDGLEDNFYCEIYLLRFATITLNFMHIELSNIVDFKLSDYHCG